MDIYQAMQARYSVRAYQDREVEQEKLDRVLDAGRIAPSARNAQAWKFVVARDGQLRENMAKAAEQPLLAKAPVVIAAVATDPERIMRCGIRSAPIDLAIAIDHMTLAATAEGLGTCWIGSFDQDACCNLLDVPPAAQIIELLVLGYPADEPKAKPRKDLSEVVCYETFS